MYKAVASAGKGAKPGKRLAPQGVTLERKHPGGNPPRSAMGGLLVGGTVGPRRSWAMWGPRRVLPGLGGPWWGGILSLGTCGKVPVYVKTTHPERSGQTTALISSIYIKGKLRLGEQVTRFRPHSRVPTKSHLNVDLFSPARGSWHVVIHGSGPVGLHKLMCEPACLFSLELFSLVLGRQSLIAAPWGPPGKEAQACGLNTKVFTTGACWPTSGSEPTKGP